MTIVFHPLFFFFNDTATTEIYTVSYTLSLHDALPISRHRGCIQPREAGWELYAACLRSEEHTSELQSQLTISYAVFCLKKKKVKIYKGIQAKSKQRRQGRRRECRRYMIAAYTPRTITHTLTANVIFFF